MLFLSPVVLSIAISATFLAVVDAFLCSDVVLSAKARSKSHILQKSTHLSVRNVVSAEGPSISGGTGSVEAEVMSLRASEIKKILTSLNANTKGLYDKEELAKLLIQIEQESLSHR